MPFISQTPEPPKHSLDEAQIIPEATANCFSLMTFGWMTSLLGLGYTRPLEATDLYKLQSEMGASYIADQITESFARRVKTANEYNEKLANGEIKPGLEALWWTILGNREAKEKKWRDETGRKKPSIVLAMNDSIKWWFWSAGLFKVAADTAQITGPLVVKVRFYVVSIFLVFLIIIQRLSLILPLNHSQITSMAYLFQALVRGLDLFSYYSAFRLSHPSASINTYIAEIGRASCRERV